MMDDLISRQTAIDALMNLTVYKSKREIVQAADKHEGSWIGAIAECIDEIEDLPSVQPEHPKGEWIMVKRGDQHHHYQCSVCGFYLITSEKIIKEEKYCIRCGADMTKGGDNDRLD